MKGLILIPFAALAVAACDADPAEDEAAVTNLDSTATDMAMNAGNTATAGVQTVSWDADNDTLVDQNEWTGVGDQGLAGWDADDDDALGTDEFERGWTEAGFTNGAEAFTALDDNNDQKIGSDEFFTEDEFTEWDTNSNATLERNEFTFYAT